MVTFINVLDYKDLEREDKNFGDAYRRPKSFNFSEKKVATIEEYMIEEEYDPAFTIDKDRYCFRETFCEEDFLYSKATQSVCDIADYPMMIMYLINKYDKLGVDIVLYDARTSKGLLKLFDYDIVKDNPELEDYFRKHIIFAIYENDDFDGSLGYISSRTSAEWEYKNGYDDINDVLNDSIQNCIIVNKLKFLVVEYDSSVVDYIYDADDGGYETVISTMLFYNGKRVGSGYFYDY